MRTRAVLWAVVVCAGAWLAALVTWPWSGDGAIDTRASEATRTVGIDPAGVVRVRVNDGERWAEATRSGASWMVTDAGGSWAGDEGAIRSAVRAIVSATLRESPAPESASVRTSIEIETRDGARASLAFASSGVGGLVEARLESLANGDTDGWGVLAPAPMLEVVASGLSGRWRSAALLPRIEPGPSRVRVSSGERGVRLVRVAGRWRFEGSSARVDQEGAEALIARLGAVRASGWLEALDGDAVAEVELETSRPDGSVWTQRVELVGQADLAGELVSVRVSREHDGETRVVAATVPAETLSGLPAGERGLVDRRSLDAAAGDVDRVRVGGRAASRDGGTWRDGKGVLLAPGDAARLEALLAVLTRREGTIEDRPTGSGVVMEIAVVGDDEARRFALHVSPGRLTVWDGATARGYGVEGTAWGLD